MHSNPELSRPPSASMSMPVQVGLVQFSELFQGHQFFPYSIGLLQAYALQNLSEPAKFEFHPLVFLPESVEALAEQLKSLQIVGFSVYVWNIKRSLALAQLLKLQNPGVLIVFGGPHVPDQAEAFLRENPFIDLCCHGAGEEAFTSLLEVFPHNRWQSIAGVSYLDLWGKCVYQPPLPRSRDLAKIPSPYALGLFQPLLRAYPHLRWIASWETNRGCPFSCTYCDWGSAIASKIGLFQMEQLSADLEWFGANQIDMVFCADANFGILKRDLEIAKQLAQVYKRYGYPHTFHQQTAKNSPDRTWDLHQILSQAGIFSEVTLSLQSMDAHTLKQIKRDNISLPTFLNLQKRFQQAGIATYTDMILALPGETYSSFVLGVEQAVNSGQHSRMQFYNAYVLPNSEMAQPAYRALHGIETVSVSLPPERLNYQDFDECGEMVIATASLPRPDWIKVRIFAWMSKFLYYLNKPLQIPLLLLQKCAQIPFHLLIEAFISVEKQSYPLLSENYAFFEDKAHALQGGHSDTYWYHHPTREGVSIPMAADHYLLLKLCQEDQLGLFYCEAEARLLQLLADSGSDFDPVLLSDAVAFNAALFKTTYMTKIGDPDLPFKQEQIAVFLNYNLPEVYQALLSGQPWQWRLQSQVFQKMWAGAPFLLEHRFLPESSSLFQK
jgi:radical SAM superfamily enzyme YgiQ (UPF0313 family)